MRSCTTSCESLILLFASTPWNASTSEKRGTWASGAEAAAHGFLDRHAAEEDVAPCDAARREVGPGLLVLLVLEQAADERLTWSSSSSASASSSLARRRRGQQHLRLDMRERRGHDEVFAREIQVEQLEDREIFKVLLGHEPDRDVENVELVLSDRGAAANRAAPRTSGA